jgi:hypothetical protein
VISRLGRVELVSTGPRYEIQAPHICWIDTPNLRAFNNALLARFNFAGSERFYTPLRGPGPKAPPHPDHSAAGLYWIFADLPKACLVAQPATQGGGARSLDSSTPDLAAFRAAIIEEIPVLASYIERQLNLEGSPSHGFGPYPGSLDLPLIEDRDGPPSDVVLVADTIRYAASRLPTSPYDRQLHYSLTDRQREAVLGAITAAQEADPVKSFELVRRAVSTEYTDAAIKAEDVARLARECEQLRASTSATDAISGLDTILSICRSAESYHLGIFVNARQ